MIVTDRDLSNLNNISKGKSVAYVDRPRLRFRGASQYKDKGRHYPLGVSSTVENALRTTGWSALYSTSLWGREFPSLASVFLNTAWGFGHDATVATVAWATNLLGISRPMSRLGMVESIFAGPQKRPHAIIKVPSPNGGYSLHEFALVAPPEVASYLGQSVEFSPNTRTRRARIRPISPPTMLSNGKISHLSALELVSILESHGEKMDFAGSWKREILPSVFLGKECLPEELAGLYVHRETGEGVLAMRGTRPLNMKDWLVNIRTTHGSETSHHRQALATATAAMKIAPNLLLAGHSKGGGLAQFVSCHLSLPAVTFNTVGLPPPLVHPRPTSHPTIEHFIIRFDPVSNFGGAGRGATTGIRGPIASLRGLTQNIIGTGETMHILPPPADRGQIMALHSLKSFKEVLRENPMVIPNPTQPNRSPAFSVIGMLRCPDSGEMLYEVNSRVFHSGGRSTRKTLQSKTPSLSRNRTTPSSISTSTVSKFL